MNEQLHYLKMSSGSNGGWSWECTCGKAKGHGPTTLACEFSFERHLVSVEFQQKRGRL